jgi:ubiquitin carboxyl-terminal hydrolase 36/42
MANIGNTCFLNAIVQALLHTPPLVAYMRTLRLTPDMATAAPMLNRMQMLSDLYDRCDNRSHLMVPGNLVASLSQLSGANMRFGAQEDAHEFLRVLLRHLHEDSVRIDTKTDGLGLSVPARIAETATIQSIFGGYFQSQVVCLSCVHQSVTYEPFLDVSLDMTEHTDSLDDCFELFCCPERLGNNNKCVDGAMWFVLAAV